MIADEPKPQPGVEEMLQLMDLLKTALLTQDLEKFAELVVARLVGMMQLPSALLYVSDPRLPAPGFYQYGLQLDTMSEIKNLCVETLDQIPSQPDIQQLFVSIPALGEKTSGIRLYPLYTKDGCIGLIGFTLDEDLKQGWLLDVLKSLSALFASAINDLLERLETKRQLNYLNTYLTVSSMLSQSLDLRELLEMILSCCMDVASAEAASVLLLDEEKKDLSFYQVEGPTKTVLVAATFPADRGIAGSILQTLQSEVINDVHSDPRFYKEVDSDTGFQTRNMIAIPLVAGEEKIGVLEVLNKVEEGSFTEEERLLLVSIAEEIAFAIRNAKLFEYIANTYCKQRQGQMSCRGCERPLGSWTPCVKYRALGV
jgi:putative methionine-R-sulfoxide reductase with GAF domain